MSKLTSLIKAVCGLRTERRLDGKLLPAAARDCKPLAVAHDRRLSAGIFAVRAKRSKDSPQYRLIAWRTYRTRTGKERATTLLYRDEIDPALALLAKCGDRLGSL